MNINKNENKENEIKEDNNDNQLNKNETPNNLIDKTKCFVCEFDNQGCQQDIQ